MSCNKQSLTVNFMSRNKKSRKYLIGGSYLNNKFDWPFDLVTVKLCGIMACMINQIFSDCECCIVGKGVGINQIIKKLTNHELLCINISNNYSLLPPSQEKDVSCSDTK